MAPTVNTVKEQWGLTPKQQCFVEEYLVDLNATRAAIRAGYSSKTARQAGAENLSKPDIQTAVAKAQSERSERTRVRQDQVIEELARVAFSDISAFVDMGPEGVKIKRLDDLPADAKRCVAEVSQTKTGVKFKLHDKLNALNALGRHLGMFTDKTEHRGSVTIKVATGLPERERPRDRLQGLIDIVPR